MHIWPHVTTLCYGLATRSTYPRLTQRTVKTGVSIYRPRRSSNTACSPRNDSLLRTTLALQQLAYVQLAVQASNQIDTPPANLTNCQKPRHRFTNDSTDRSFPLRSSSYIHRLDRSQLPAMIVQLHSTTRPIFAYSHQTSSCISTTRPTPATLVERLAAHNFNSTIPAFDMTHPSWRPHTTPTDFTYTFVIPTINRHFCCICYLAFCLPSLSLAVTTRTPLNTKFICGTDTLIGSAHTNQPTNQPKL